MENFFYGDNFFSDLSECCNYQDWDKEELNSLPEDFEIEIELSDLEPILKLNASFITANIDEIRFSEDNAHNDIDRLERVLNENIDFENVNTLIPKMYYPSGEFRTIKKTELLAQV